MSSTASFSLVGVVHLLPLPGGPRSSPGLQAVIDAALADADAMARGGLREIILENFGDAPFRATGVSPHVPAMMCAVGLAVRARFPELSLGVNVLRNDARAALGVAAALGARFVRVNVHVGSVWTDQGLIQGEAHETLCYRRQLGADQGPSRVAILADVAVKHGQPAGERDLGRLAADTALRGGADTLIVTGAATGATAELADVVAAKQAGGVPVWVGSGVVPTTLPAVRAVADGAIVGTWLHGQSRLDQRVQLDRVRAIVEA